ncbi:SsgA family sporulation/cell division regulator [Dactylosporangium sp. CA-139066]|uniref:SsgA family sporulation/cell division regulator n=1 Tax=Dactylosporangium sp. CA-139066 TaxID=3239930 RepID=UPI003D90C3B9
MNRIADHHIQGRVVMHGHADGVIPLRWIYDPRRPFAVTVDCGIDAVGARIVWTFARVALDVGRNRRVVDPGWVTVRPALGSGGRHVRLDLAPPGGEVCTLMVRRQPLDAFLNEAFGLVPAGGELEHLDWDLAATDLFGVSR